MSIVILLHLAAPSVWLVAPTQEHICIVLLTSFSVFTASWQWPLTRMIGSFPTVTLNSGC